MLLGLFGEPAAFGETVADGTAGGFAALLFEGFVDTSLYAWGWTAGAGAEIDECVGGEGRAEDLLKGGCCEGCGRGWLQNGELQPPEELEAGLDLFAEELGKPGKED